MRKMSTLMNKISVPKNKKMKKMMNTFDHI